MGLSLADMRKQAGFATQQELANALNVSDRSTIAQWEIGNRYPRMPMLNKLAGILLVSEGEIIAAITKAKEETA